MGPQRRQRFEDAKDEALDLTTSLAVPALSIAGIAALNSGLHSFAGAAAGTGTHALASAGVLAAAAAAGEAGVKYYNDRRWTQAGLDQTQNIYEREKTQAERLHHEALRSERALHYQELEREAEQHLQDMTNQLRESQKEADRDLWEQQNTETQSSMTVAALFLAAALALAVEGSPNLPRHAEGLMIAPSIPLFEAFYFCLAACIAFLFISILSGMVVVKRMAHFMLSRTAKQQETLRQLRELANKQLRELQGEKDGDVGCFAEAEGGSSRRLSRYSRDLHGRLQQARQQFSQHLWEQPVMVMNWRPIGSGRHVVSFHEWYFYDKVSTIALLTYQSFKVGAVLVVLALGIYVEGLLVWGGEEGEPPKRMAARMFWAILLSIAGSSFVYLEVLETMFPTPRWRDTIVQTARDNSQRDLVEDCQRQGRRPSLFLPRRAQPAGASSQRKHKRPSLWARLLRPLRYESTLETVNVEVMKVQGGELFQAIDANDDGCLNVEEICEALGFDLPLMHGAAEEPPPPSSGHDPPHPVAGAGDGEGAEDEEEPGHQAEGTHATGENRAVARQILRQHSILQEAVVKLLVRKVRSHQQFLELRRANAPRAERYIQKVRSSVSAALQAIDRGEEGPAAARQHLLRHRLRPWCFRPRDGKQPLGWTISKQEWDEIMTGICHDKFF